MVVVLWLDVWDGGSHGDDGDSDIIVRLMVMVMEGSYEDMARCGW